MPKAPFNSGGKRPTGTLRIRNGILGAVLEELMEEVDGSFTWQRSLFPHVTAEGGTVKGYCYARRQWGTGRKRIRNGLFGAVVEEMFENSDGSTTWQRFDGEVRL